MSAGAFAPDARADAYADAARETFAGCILQTVKGATLSIESYACGPEAGNVRLIADDTLPGFVSTADSDEGQTRNVVIQAFKKSAGAPIDDVLPAIRSISPGSDADTCTLQLAPGGDDQNTTRYAFAPTGAAKTAWDTGIENGNPVEPPCGPFGVQFAGDLYFQVLPDDPTIVVFINAGSEIQIFNPGTLKSLSTP